MLMILEVKTYLCYSQLISLLIYDLGAPGGSALPTGGFGIGEEQLTTMMRDHNFSAIEEGGGVGNQIGCSVFSSFCFITITFCQYFRSKD